MKACIEVLSFGTLVIQIKGDSESGQHIPQLLRTSSRQCDMERMIFGTADDPRREGG